MQSWLSEREAAVREAVAAAALVVPQRMPRLDEEQRNALIANVRQAIKLLKLRQVDVAAQVQLPGISEQASRATNISQ